MDVSLASCTQVLLMSDASQYQGKLADYLPPQCGVLLMRMERLHFMQAKIRHVHNVARLASKTHE